MKTLLRKFLCALVFAGGMLGVSLTAPVQAATCTIGLGPICVTIGGSASAQTAPAPMLVLYDAPPNDQYTNLGKSYAIMLYNLLAHFNTTITLLPVQNYTAGMTEQYTAIFYMGSYYNNPIPAAFLSDVTTTQKTVVWFKYNLWELAWNTAYPFTSRYGISFSNLAGMNAAPSASAPNPGFFDTVTYKNQTMTKYYAFNATTGAISADPDIGVTAVADATKATSLVTITNSVTKATAPYVIRSGNFWYFADMPFSYIGPRDRYLVICDMLHDILGTNAPTLHRALVRLEDINATNTVTSINTLTDYLYSNKIPFSLATIPLYKDPNGVYNGGVAQTIHLVNATGLKSALNHALARGGEDPDARLHPPVQQHPEPHQRRQRERLRVLVRHAEPARERRFNAMGSRAIVVGAAGVPAQRLRAVRLGGAALSVVSASHQGGTPVLQDHVSARGVLHLRQSADAECLDAGS